MCRSIKVLRRPGGGGELATPGEISAASLQFVRKVSGHTRPSKANEKAFDTAVAEVAAATSRLLRSMQPGKPTE